MTPFYTGRKVEAFTGKPPVLDRQRVEAFILVAWCGARLPLCEVALIPLETIATYKVYKQSGELWINLSYTETWLSESQVQDLRWGQLDKGVYDFYEKKRAVRQMVWEVKVNREAGAPLWVFSTRQPQETRRGQGAYSVPRSHMFKRGRSIPLEHTTTNQDLRELLETEEAEDSEHPPAGPQQGNQQRYPRGGASQYDQALEDGQRQAAEPATPFSHYQRRVLKDQQLMDDLRELKLHGEMQIQLMEQRFQQSSRHEAQLQEQRNEIHMRMKDQCCQQTLRHEALLQGQRTKFHQQAALQQIRTEQQDDSGMVAWDSMGDPLVEFPRPHADHWVPRHKACKAVW